MKKKNAFLVQVINNNNFVAKSSFNLTQKYKTPRGDDKKRRKHTKEKENKENSYKNITKNSSRGIH